MEFDYTTVSLKDIQDNDNTYRITTSGQANIALSSSIKRIGLINPPILQRQDNFFIVVSGFGRIAACRALGWDRMDVRCVLKAVSFAQCALTAIVDNATQRTLNIVELARSFGLLAKALTKQEEVIEAFNSVGLDINQSLADKLQEICRMTDELQQGLIQGSIALPVALKLHAMQHSAEVHALTELLRDLNLSLNRQRELLDWVRGVCLREKVSTIEILESKQVVHWRRDEHMDKGRKSQLIRQYLKRRRYPEITAFEQQFTAKLKALKLPSGVSLMPPPHFEGQRFSLDIEFENQDELQRLLEGIKDLVHSPALSKLMEPIESK